MKAVVVAKNGVEILDVEKILNEICPVNTEVSSEVAESLSLIHI